MSSFPRKEGEILGNYKTLSPEIFSRLPKNTPRFPFAPFPAARVSLSRRRHLQLLYAGRRPGSITGRRREPPLGLAGSSLWAPPGAAAGRRREPPPEASASAACPDHQRPIPPPPKFLAGVPQPPAQGRRPQARRRPSPPLASKSGAAAAASPFLCASRCFISASPSCHPRSPAC